MFTFRRVDAAMSNAEVVLGHYLVQCKVYRFSEDVGRPYKLSILLHARVHITLSPYSILKCAQLSEICSPGPVLRIFFFTCNRK